MTKRRVDMDRLQELVRLHRMGTGAREVARMLRMSPNTEREYRQALEKEGLLDGPAEDIAALEALKTAVQRQLPVVAPPQMVSTAEPLRDKIVELAEKGVKARAIFDRLRLEDPTFSASYWSVRGVWRRWRKERGVRAEDVRSLSRRDLARSRRSTSGTSASSARPPPGCCARRGCS